VSRTGDVLYATALGWPSSGTLTLHTLYKNNPYLSTSICSVKLLGTDKNVDFHQQADGTHLILPAIIPSALPADIAWVFANRTHSPGGRV